MAPVRAFVALGGNVGDTAARFDAACAALAAASDVELLRRSSNVVTAPVGGPPGQRDYLNAVVELETTLAARALLELLQEVERANGRERALEERWGPRTLDLDLLLHGAARVTEPGLTVPHPRLEERSFVLAPLAELAPELVLAGCGRSVAERLTELESSEARAR